jgi:hypothetical protein
VPLVPLFAPTHNDAFLYLFCFSFLANMPFLVQVLKICRTDSRKQPNLKRLLY